MQPTQDETTVYLPDGRVLRAVRTWFSIPVGAVQTRMLPSVEWRFTLDGDRIDQAQAEELAAEALRLSERTTAST